MRRFLLPAAVVFTFAALVVPGGSASVSGPHCGEVVTTSVVLTEDLVCSGDGLIIPGSADVVVDFAGHSITGSGTGIGVRIVDSPLSEDPAGSTLGAVTIEAGAIQGFSTGVHIQSDHVGEATLLLDRLLIRGNGQGVSNAVSNGPFTLLSNSIVTSNEGDGVRIGPSRFRIVNVQVTKNGGNGIAAFRNSLDALQDSFVARNGEAGAWLDDTVAVISGNTFLRNNGTGLRITEESCGFFPLYVISDNIAEGNGAGGMSMRANCSLDPTPSPTMSGNAAKNNESFQCILIVCAKNPGKAK